MPINDLQKKKNLTILSNLNWHKCVAVLAIQQPKIVFQLRPNVAAPPTKLHQLDAVRKTYDPGISSKLLPLAHRRAVSDLSLQYRHLHAFWPQELSKSTSGNSWKINKGFVVYASIYCPTAEASNFTYPQMFSSHFQISICLNRFKQVSSLQVTTER